MRNYIVFSLAMIGAILNLTPMVNSTKNRHQEKQTINQLLEIVRDEHLKSINPVLVGDAIRDLGKFAKPELMETSIDLIDYRVPFQWERPGDPLYCHS